MLIAITKKNDRGSAICAYVFPVGVCVVVLVILKQSESKVMHKIRRFMESAYLLHMRIKGHK